MRKQRPKPRSWSLVWVCEERRNRGKDPICFAHSGVCSDHIWRSVNILNKWMDEWIEVEKETEICSLSVHLEDQARKGNLVNGPFRHVQERCKKLMSTEPPKSTRPWSWPFHVAYPRILITTSWHRHCPFRVRSTETQSNFWVWAVGKPSWLESTLMNSSLNILCDWLTSICPHHSTEASLPFLFCSTPWEADLDARRHPDSSALAFSLGLTHRGTD